MWNGSSILPTEQTKSKSFTQSVGRRRRQEMSKQQQTTAGLASRNMKKEEQVGHKERQCLQASYCLFLSVVSRL